MKNLFTRLHRRKGFTLIECLIALTVFAALTLVVFAILTNARAASVKANETEENLTKLVENVISDGTLARYNGSTTETLSLNLSTSGSTPFKVSYNEIDGYKNYVFCTDPACAHFADNTEFMNGTEMVQFNQTNYICPKCGASIVQELVCSDCNNTGDHTDTSSFTYIKTNGSYYCNDCGGTAVRGANITDETISNYDLNVKTVVPNAIVYGDVKRKTDPAVLFDTVSADLATATSNITMSLYCTNTPGSNIYVYDMYVKSDYSGSPNFQIHVNLPPGYTIADFNVENGDCSYESIANGGETFNVLKFYNCMKNADSRVTFQLINNTSSASFEEDYRNDADPNASGLKGYWFHIDDTASNKTYNGR